jgi:glycosyltransferase involved in cell wall biosynthesis
MYTMSCTAHVTIRGRDRGTGIVGVYGRMARVTVIIPTFNRAAYLEEAIASATSQDCADALVVVADNASEDDTRAVVERAIVRYGADRVEYVRRETNIGWIANFNRAFSDVRTDFALLLGDDDRLLPGALTRAVAALDRAPNAGFVHSPCDTIDEHGAIVDTATDWTKGLTEDTLEPGAVFIERTIPWMTRVFAQSALIRHTAFPDAMWDPADGLSPDYFVWLRIALDWDVQYLAEPGAQRRVHLGALSSGFGGVTGGDYVVEPDAALTLRADKLRFIDTYASRLDDPGALRRAAYRGSRRDLAAFSRGAASRSRVAGLRSLAHTGRLQPGVVVDPWTWRAAATFPGWTEGWDARRGARDLVDRFAEFGLDAEDRVRFSRVAWLTALRTAGRLSPTLRWERSGAG